MRILEITKNRSSLFRELKWLKPVFVKTAQEVYDKWILNDWDKGKYGNGICDTIAQKISKIADTYTDENVQSESVGRNKAGTHAYAVVFNQTESYAIDISYWKYETGRKSIYGDMQWKKIEGIQLTEDDVRIFKIKRMSWMDGK
jgi:hypothetical protein